MVNEYLNPYISVIVTSRNDDHGQNMLGRMQTFLDALLDQAERYKLPIELIIVEWNPPQNKPSLSKVLNWPKKESPYFLIRIIEVPQEIHQKYKHGDALGLYQMIAKNVGIRRAKGEYILSTNIDILFSEELMRSFARKQLKKGLMYRVDRFDVPSQIPDLKSVQQRLQWCHRHAFMVSDRNGSLRVKGVKGGILYSYWVTTKILETFIKIYLKKFFLFIFALPFKIIKKSCEIFFRGGKFFFTFLYQNIFMENILPILNSTFKNTDNARRIIKKLLNLRKIFIRCPRVWRFIQYTMGSCFIKIKEKRIPMFNNFNINLMISLLQMGIGVYLIKRLHTNACGDFTLMHREDWFKLGAYAEFDMYSFHIDSLIIHQGYRNGLREKYLKPWKCIFHIEHSRGSGWTPQGEEILFNRLDKASVPYIDARRFCHWINALWSNERGYRFTDMNWGLAEYLLSETNPLRQETHP